jgi:hypothetical protein
MTARWKPPSASLDADSWTTKLYDRRGQKVLLEDMERMRFDFQSTIDTIASRPASSMPGSSMEDGPIRLR